jgi:hypothetical protein
MSSKQSYSSRRKNARDLKMDYLSHVFADFHRLPTNSRTLLLKDLPSCLATLVEQLEKGISPEDEELLDWGDIAILEDKSPRRRSAG